MKKQRYKAGFTLSEVLLTIAILAVLAAVAIPGVLAARRQLKMLELNDTAREIFLAAQNTLTARKAAGTLLPAAGAKEDGTDLYWLDQDDAGYLLPPGSVEAVAAGNFYQIKYNPKTAIVLEVYYAEQSLPGDIREGGYSNDAVLRRQKQIGYYNGKDLELSEIDELPSLSSGFLVNKEELYVYFEIDPKYVPLVKLILTVEELGADGKTVVPGNSQVFTIDRTSTDSPAKFDPLTGELKLVLDSLTGPQFKERCPKITPGSDIKVTAQLVPSKEDGKDWIAPEPIWDTDNSLFGERNPSEEREMAYIAYPRHLQNLDAAYSGVTGMLDAEQTEEITWPTDIDFQSITNDGLRSYDGAKKEIKDLHDTNGQFAKKFNGLFAKFTGNLLKDIHIVDPVIRNSSVNTGALAGETHGNSENNGSEYVYDLLISDCWVYATPKADGNYGDIGISASAGYIGGLVGQAQHCTITDSFAALPSINSTASGVGGLIGQASSCVITNCYTDIDDLVTGTGYNAMFIGQIGDCIAKNCYAVGNLTSIGTMYGFTSGTGTISNSYCAVTYDRADGSAGQPLYGFAQASAVTDCAYLNTTTPTWGHIEAATALSFGDERWASLSGTWVNIPAHQSHPYRPELLGRAYPFPGLKLNKSIFNLPHYGSWPVQTVDEIKVFRADQGTDAVDYLICPTGGSISFWAEPRSNGQPVDIRVDDPKFFFSFPDGTDTNDLTAALGSAESDSLRTQITVSGNISGTYAVEVSAGGTKLWVPVIVCDPTLTLKGTIAIENGLTASNIATLLRGQPNSTVLPLRTTEKAEFSAGLTVNLTCDKVNEGMAALYTAATGQNIPLTIENKVEIKPEDWLGFRVVQNGEVKEFGPGISLNEPVTDGVYRLQPKLLDDGKLHALYQVGSNGPEPGKSDILTVTGQSAGMAAVSACWAMDSRLTVTGNIDVIGAQAFIHSAAASGSSTGDLGSKGEFPYLLAISPTPQDAVTLSFTSWLSSAAPEGATQTWTWRITDPAGKPVATLNQDDTTIPEDGVVFTFAPGELPEKLSDQIFTVWLKDSSPNARYRVQMTYSYTTSAGSTYSTSDFMYITVTRTTRHIESDPGCNLDIPESLTLEQINWGDEGVDAPEAYEGGPLNVGTVTGTVNKAADTQLLWYLKVDDKTKIMLTGMDPKKPEQVFGPDGSFIAELLWTPDYPTGEKAPPGGVITVTAQDCGYYGDAPLTFTLIAQARDNGDLADRKEIPVYIMPKLKITPQSCVTTVKLTKVSLSANRADRPNGYHWDWKSTWTNKAGNGTLTPDVNDTSKLSFDAGPRNSQLTSYTVVLTYGPYTATAKVTAKAGNNKGFESALSEDTSITADADGNGIKEEVSVLFIQKGETRNLEFAWSGSGNGQSDNYRIKTDIISPDSNRLNLNLTTVTPAPPIVNSPSGSRLYELTGNALSMEPLKLKWEFVPEKTNGGRETPDPIFCYAYVVGVEFNSYTLKSDNPVKILFPLDKSEKKEITLDGLDATADLSIASYFPSELGAGTVTITSSNDGVVSLNKTEFTPSGADTLTVAAEKYGTTALTVTYDVGSYTYKDVCTVTVNAPKDTYHAKLEPCSEELLDTLHDLFGDIITSDSDLIVYAKYPVKNDDGAVTGSKFLPTLLTGHFTGTEDPLGRVSQVENFFGHDALYLKAYLTDADGNVKPPNEIVGDMAFFSDNPALIDIYLADDPDTPGVFYLRVQARPGMGTPSGNHVTISAKFGTLPVADFETMVFSDPSVVIRDETGAVVTNGHTVIDGFDPASPQTHTFQAALYPWLVKTPSDDAAPLDDLVWFTEFPDDGYQADTFLTLDPPHPERPGMAVGPTRTVTIKASPGCKVAVNVQSKLANAANSELSKSAHALVFLPELHKNDPEP